MDVLGKKVGEVDEEISLLQELKEIILRFIKQIEESDLHNDSDIKLLYEKAKDIENHIFNDNTEDSKNKRNKVLDILPKYQWSNGVIIPINLGETTLSDYDKLTYSVKSSVDVYGKGMSAYVSTTVEDFGYLCN